MIGRTDRRLLVAGAGLILALAALSAPWLLAGNYVLAWFAISAFFSRVCHQDPARSFVLFVAPVAVCARCLGIYLGAAAGAWIRLPRRVGLRLLFAAAMLNLFDVIAEAAGVHGNWIWVRFCFGIALGAALAALVAKSAEMRRSTRLA